jgi:DNA-binding GntR family transcriptional regulator
MKEINRKPVVIEVANQIRAAILDGGLVPGSKIAQDGLAAELGVSRLPVRQALLVLQREGLVFLDHGRGAVVAPFDVKFISDLFEYRATVDGYVAGALAARTGFDPRRLRQIVREGRAAARRGESRRDLVMDFHTAQYEATGNQVLVRIMEPLLDHVQRVVTFVQTSTNGKGHDRPRKPHTRAGQPGLRSQPETWDEHAQIVEAIAHHRVGRARALARSHVDRVKQVVVAFLVSAAPARHGQPAFARTPVRPASRGQHVVPLTAAFDAGRGK